jgi:hypothetical protein
MNVFADFHHEDLLYSLYLLFEIRLGWKLYRPYGMEWFSSGDWKLESESERARGLLFDFSQADESKIPYRTHKNVINQDVDVLINDSKRPAVTYRGIRRSDLPKIDIDLYVSTVPQHVDVFNSLIKRYHPRAKHIFQAGNRWDLKTINCANIMHSCTIDYKIDKKNTVHYMQEFDLVDIAGQWQADHKSIVNMQNNLGYYNDSMRTFNVLKNTLTGFKFKSYGIDNDDGFFIGTIADAIKEYGYSYYVKYGGEGYGHYAHQSIAMGKPLIVKKHLYKGMTIDKILIDGLTCINLDNKNIYDVCTYLDKVSKEQYLAISADCARTFREKINFDEEFVKVKKFLEKML